MAEELNPLEQLYLVAQARERLRPAIRDDGTIDIETAKRILKSDFRGLAKIYHPDRNGGNGTAEEAFKGLNEGNQRLQDLDDPALGECISRFVNGSTGGNDQLLAQAMAEIETLDDRLADSNQRLVETQALLIGLGEGRRYNPDQVMVYHRNGIKITLANAQTEIPRLIAGRPDPALEERLRVAERQISEYLQSIKRKDEIIRTTEEQLGSERRKGASLNADKISAERNYETERVRANDLDAKHKAALRTIREETEARAMQQKRADNLESTLRATTDAASTLMTAELAKQRAEYEARITALEAALPTDDPIETLLAQKTESNDPSSWYILAQYLITKESVKEKKDQRKIKQAEENIKKALKSDYSLLESTIALARGYQYQGQDEIAVGIMKGVYAAVDDTKEREVRIKGGRQGYHAYSPQFSTLITAMIDKESDHASRKETRGKLIPLVQKNTDFEDPLYHIATALRLEKEFDLAEELGITLANASNKPKYWSFIANVISDSPTGKRPDRVQWAEECYRKAGK